jgi:iron complex transport system substrate-binding protein
MLRKIIALTLFAALLFGCAPVVTPQPGPATGSTHPASVQTELPPASFTDGLGRQIKLDHIPQRIVSLAPSNTEILFAVGAGSQVVGRDDFSDYPEAVKSLPKVGGTDKYNNEQIVALHPDLVLAAEINTPEQVKALESLELTVYYLKNPATLEEMYGNLETVAKLTGHEADAATLADSLEARVAEVDNKVAAVTERPSVFYEIDATDPAKPYTAGPGTFIDLLIQRAGGTNIAGTLKDQYPQLSLEQVVALNPSFIVLGDSLYGVTPDAVKARPGWGSLSAVKNGNIFPVDDNLFSRPGPRLVDGLELLAKLLHPEWFQ